MTKYPKIIIKYNRFLDPIFIKAITVDRPDWKVPDKDLVLENIKMYNAQWKKYGRKILNGICNTTGLMFYRNQIDVHIVSGNGRTFSRPVILKSRYTADEFICALTHELIHCLFVDNDTTPEFYSSVLYPHEKEIVAKHVIVHAILECVYTDILKCPDLLATDKAMAETSTKLGTSGYDEAWKIVEEEGYRTILAKYFPNGCVG